jgi:hypothetical protein
MAEELKDLSGTLEAPPVKEPMKQTTEEVLKEIREKEDATKLALDKSAADCVERIRAERKASIREMSSVKRLLMIWVVIAFLSVGLAPAITYWSVLHWAESFDTVWARVVVFSVPQLVLCILVSALILSGRRGDE